MPEFLNFTFEYLVFSYLVFQKPCCDLRLFAQPRWCKHIGIGDPVVAVFEVARLQPALFHQALEAIVGLAEADPHLFGQLPLAEVGVLFYEIEELIGNLFVHVGIFSGYSYQVIYHVIASPCTSLGTPAADCFVTTFLLITD